MSNRSASFYLPTTDETYDNDFSPNSVVNSQNIQKEINKKETSGWLMKWTNYVKGYRKRWFLLDASGNLSYYRNPKEVNENPRGVINLAEASIHNNQNDPGHHLVITSPISPTFHLKAVNEIERSKWVKALEYAKHRAIRQASNLEDDEDANQLFLAKTNDLKELPTIDLTKMAKDINSMAEKLTKDFNGYTHYVQGHMIPGEAKKCAEKVIPIKQQIENITKTTSEVLLKYKMEYDALRRLANFQNEKYVELQKQYEILARQHSQLEHDAYNSLHTTINGANSDGNNMRHTSPPYVPEESEEDDSIKFPTMTVDNEEDQFHDAVDNLEIPRGSHSNGDNFSAHKTSSSSSEEKGNNNNHRKNSALISGKLDFSKCNIHVQSKLAEYHENTHPTAQATGHPPKNRRETIPEKPESHGLNLWSILKNCIGKELTRIPIPVNFNEPLSMLQRITEDLEYSYLLDRAAEKRDICERLAYVAAYAITSYSGTSKRTTKPFNPLLGETYEFDRREDLGWRSLVEQVSHHPPMCAQHAEGANWVMHQEFMVSSRFRGTYLSVVPTGFSHVNFKDGKAMCTFQKITTTVHNIIVGKLWIDNHGEMNIVNHVSGERAVIKFHSYSFFSSNRPRKVEGLILNKQGEAKFYLEGYWDQHINIAPVIGQKMDGNKFRIEAGQPKRIWNANQPGSGPSKFNFSKLAIQMNEPEEFVAPTDSRNRPDQRLMENGNWDEANKIKNQLEDKQRKARKQAEADAERAMNNDQEPEEYQPRWFKKVQDAQIGSVIHVIRDNEYWDCKERRDWTRCQNIF